jgi:signal peptidase II
MMRDRLTVILIAAAVLAADQVTKALLVVWLPLHARYEVVENLFTINHVQNYGAAFGLFANVSGNLLRWVLVIVSIAAVGLIWAYAREGWHEPKIVHAFGMILGGALGNLVDRLRLGYVVDFLDVHWGSHHWPSFNVADAAITVGAVILFLAMAQQSTATQHDDELLMESTATDNERST